jgi:hypothetical protein
MELTKEQGLYCANVFSDYFDRFQRIDDYISYLSNNTINEKLLLKKFILGKE